MKRPLILFSVLLLLNVSAFAQTAPATIWSDPIADANPSAQNPFNSPSNVSGYVKDSRIAVSGIGRGTGLTAQATNNRYDATDWTTGSSRDLNDYFSFTLTPNPGFRIYYDNFYFDYQRTNANSPTTYQVYSSLDGFTSPITTGTLSNTSNTNATVSLTAPAFQNTTTAVTFRLYAYNAGASTAAFGINDFGFVGIIASTTLKLELENFSGQKKDQKLVLKWNTLCESNLRSFQLEKAVGSNPFTTIETVSAANKGCGETSSYEYTDNLNTSGIQLYRLRTTGSDGATSYSKTLSFNGAQMASGFIEVQPNPASDFIQISGVTPGAVYYITDMTGKVVVKGIADNNGGNVQVQQLQSGLYFVNVAGQKSVKFVKQ